MNEHLFMRVLSGIEYNSKGEKGRRRKEGERKEERRETERERGKERKRGREEGGERKRKRERERFPGFLRQKFGISSMNDVIASNQCTHRRAHLSLWHADYLKFLLPDYIITS